MNKTLYCLLAGLAYSIGWWLLIGYPDTWDYFGMLLVAAVLIVAAPDFKKDKR